jgi:hypothetical protein
VEKSFDQQTESVKQEKLAQTMETEAIRQKLEAVQVGGLHISAIGVVWLVVGVCMSTSSIELAKWFG